MAVAVAWAGPLEHLIDRAWSPARHYFPGLLLEAVGAGGTDSVSVTHAALAAGACIVLFAVLSPEGTSPHDHHPHDHGLRGETIELRNDGAGQLSASRQGRWPAEC